MDQMDLALHAPETSAALPLPAAKRKSAAPMLLVAAAVIAAAIFIADTVTQLEVAVAVLYVAVILIVARIFERKGVLVVASACVGLTILSFFVSREDLSPSTGFVNCMISIAAILVSTYLAIQNRTALMALHESQSELAHANRVTTMGELTAAIVHEVNQPVAGVVANAEAAMRWLEAQPPEMSEAKQALEAIVEDGKRTSEIVNRIRALARKEPLRREGLDINEIIVEVIALMRTQLHRADVMLHTEFSDRIATIYGDRIQMQQVMLNLILNAVEAMAAVNGHRHLRISTQAHSPGGVLVAVSDMGTGLGGEADRLFDAFYTTKPSGMGMGLSICRTIVESHGGRIRAAPNDSGGATFQFTLPQHARRS